MTKTVTHRVIWEDVLYEHTIQKIDIATEEDAAAGHSTYRYVVSGRVMEGSRQFLALDYAVRAIVLGTDY